jgi:fucose 4-O-acetylase-like acetyltransferase
MTSHGNGSETLEPITSGVRSTMVDIVKGIAIILVAFGHTAEGLMHRGWWVGPRAVYSKAFIYSFHMPAFFFVSGLFVMDSLGKRGGRKFSIDKVRTILWPYLLFSVINVALNPLLGRFKSTPAPVHWNIFLLQFADGESSWFLFTLFFCFMLALLTATIPASLRFFLAVALAMTPTFGPPLTNQVFHEFCFLAAGMWVGTKIYRLQRLHVLPAFLGFLSLVLLQSLATSRLQTNRCAYVTLGLTGTAAIFLLAKLLDGHNFGDGLAWIGRASLAIFLLASYPQGAAREVLSRIFNTHNLWLQLILPTSLAVLLPAIIWYQQDRWRINWLFRWPSSQAASLR